MSLRFFLCFPALGNKLVEHHFIHSPGNTLIDPLPDILGHAELLRVTGEKAYEEKIQKITDKMIEKVDKAIETKTKEIMTV